MRQTPAKSGYNSQDARDKGRVFKLRHQSEVQKGGGLTEILLPEQWQDARYVYGSKYFSLT